MSPIEGQIFYEKMGYKSMPNECDGPDMYKMLK